MCNMLIYVSNPIYDQVELVFDKVLENTLLHSQSATPAITVFTNYIKIFSPSSGQTLQTFREKTEQIDQRTQVKKQLPYPSNYKSPKKIIGFNSLPHVFLLFLQHRYYALGLREF